MAARKVTVTHEAHICGSRLISMGQCCSGLESWEGFVRDMACVWVLKGEWCLYRWRVPGGKNHMSKHENRVSSENLAWGPGAMGRNLEGQVWVNLGRTEKTMEPEYMQSLRSPACHSLAKRVLSKKRWPCGSQRTMALNAWVLSQHPWHYLWAYETGEARIHWIRHSGDGSRTGSHKLSRWFLWILKFENHQRRWAHTLGKSF